MKNMLKILTVLMLVSPSYAFAKEYKWLSLSKEIKQMIADLSCDDSRQCKSLGFGSRACGGYEKYLIYSTKNVDETLLEQKAEEYFKADAESNRNAGMASICSVEQPKFSICLNHHCEESGQLDSPRSR